MSRKSNAKPRYTLALNCAVYLRSETDPANKGTLTGFTIDRQFAWVCWPDKTTQHATAKLCVPEEWDEIREKQASLATYWGGAR